MMEVEEDNKKYYAVVRVDNLDLPDNVGISRLHSHISSAVDEALENLKGYLKEQGITGKFLTSVEVFVKEEAMSRLVETIKAKIKT
ncbi:hypothetical protein [Acidianus sp. HS-5]|uniref:hypothetical protein n=1 Tax=Acidianus sp. HS-5 TaxID=2886040 RepID=UPI001F301777|nr:hypothetical protein [Acidianus sp. HS-5]BDC19023.1 hypothetical protein HS5_19130 [Acidianus sp. HS-5]